MRKNSYICIGHRNKRTEIIYFDSLNQRFLLRKENKISNFVGTLYFFTVIFMFFFRPLRNIYLSENYVSLVILGIFLGSLISFLISRALVFYERKQVFKPIELSSQELNKMITDLKNSLNASMGLVLFFILLFLLCFVVFYFERSLQLFLLIPMNIPVISILTKSLDFKRRKQLIRQLESE